MQNLIPSLGLSILAGVMAVSASQASEPVVVEWAPFIKAEGVADQALIEAADKVNIDFLKKQKGYVSRELVKKSDHEYADILHWTTKADAIAASEKIHDCEVCGAYFKLMDFEANAKAGAGFSHYTILKKW